MQYKISVDVERLASSTPWLRNLTDTINLSSLWSTRVTDAVRVERRSERVGLISLRNWR